MRLERALMFNGSRFRGFAITVAWLGSYRVFFNATSPESSGWLLHDGIPSFAVDHPADNFYSNVQPTETIRPTSNEHGGGSSSAVVIAVSIVVTLVVISIVAVACWYGRHRMLLDHKLGASADAAGTSNLLA